jgi:hypothetical protein
MQFVTKNSSVIDLKIIQGSKNITNTCSTKFLGITLDNTLSWKTHTGTIIPKLSSACFAICAVKPFLSPESLKMVYYSYFHSIMTYGIIFSGNSYYSNTIFNLQNKTLRIIMGMRDRDSCGEHFKKLKILPLKSQYILSVALLLVNNKNYFQTNTEIHDINTRTKSNLHQTLSHLSKYQKGTHCFVIKVFSSLPARIKDLSHNLRQFKSALRAFLYSHSFYTLDEYFNYNKT